MTLVATADTLWSMYVTASRDEAGKGRHGQSLHQAYLCLALDQRKLRCRRPVSEYPESGSCSAYSSRTHPVQNGHGERIQSHCAGIVEQVRLVCCLQRCGCCSCVLLTGNSFSTRWKAMVSQLHVQALVHPSKADDCMEDDMPGHIKSTLIGASLNIPITNGKFNLGTWQGLLR